MTAHTHTDGQTDGQADPQPHDGRLIWSVGRSGGLGSHLYRPPAPLVDTPLSAVCDVSSVNITPMLVLTRQVVEQMVRSRRKGVVIHVSGFAGRLAMPILRELSGE